jgi:transposase
MYSEGGAHPARGPSQPDIRKSIDGMCATMKSLWREDAFARNLFAFVSRRGDRVKVLTWESGGLAL